MNSKRHNPPHLPLRFFRWFCHPDYREDIEGDLLERFERNQSRWRFAVEVLTLFRPGIIKEIKGIQKLNGFTMFRNHFKVSIRNLYRNKQYAVINIVGLSIAIGIALSLFSIVRFERSFDTYHSNYDRAFQIMRFGRLDDGAGSHIPYGVIHALEENVPEVEAAGAVLKDYPPTLEIEDRKLKHSGAYFIEPEIFKIIDINWLSGSPETSLSQPNQVVLDTETARKLFGERESLGKKIRYNNNYDLIVAGIIEKVPANSEFQFKMLVSMETRRLDQDYWETKDNWAGGDSDHHGYVLIREGADPKVAEAKLDEIFSEYEEEYKYVGFEFISLNDAHFNPASGSYNYGTKEWIMESLLYISGFFILIACINFINLSTAQTLKRNKEIAVRKVMGSSRRLILGQFLIETGIIVLISLVFAVCVGSIIQNQSGHLLNTGVAEANVWSLSTFIFLAALGVLITLLSGLYPAFVSSRFTPAEIFNKGQSKTTHGSVPLRKVLIICQFAIAQIMVIGVIIGSRQMEFFYNKDLGFDQESIVTISMPDKENSEKRELLRTQLLQHPEIHDATFGLTAPSSHSNQWWSTVNHNDLSDEFVSRFQFVDLNYFDFYGIELLAGRQLLPNDSTRWTIVNEEATKKMGLDNPEEALGKTITAWAGEDEDSRLTIVGVVKNYHSQSLKSRIVPHFYIYGPWNFQTASIRLNPESLSAGIDILEKYWTSLFPDDIFEYQFLSESMKGFYENERKISNILSLFAIASTLIGCMGLYGLIYFVCISRTKEFGIRKVLGSTVAGIVTLLSKDFVKLILIAFVIAAPVGWYLMDSFLQNYTYTVSITFDVFLIAGVTAIIVTLLAIGYQSLKTAMSNPSEALRDE